LIRHCEGSPQDIRDKAILELLAIYGLRSGEVTRLRLEDLKWSQDRILVTRPKQRRSQEYPLLPCVGESILRYLQKVRPRRGDREVVSQRITFASATSLASSCPVYRMNRNKHLPTPRKSRELLHYRRSKLESRSDSEPHRQMRDSLFGEVLRQRSLPELLERPDIPISTAPERELPVANPMGKLDAGQYRSSA
jgi:site-specific recombinase XerD